MMIIIAYSCFLSAYYAAFDFPLQNPLCYWMENLCTLFFTLDIVFNFMRVPDDRDVNSETKVTHSTIGLRYIKGGKFFIDVIATVPLYLITYVQGQRTNWEEQEGGNQYGVFLKLVRLVRISRLINLLDPSAVHKIGEILF